VSDALHRYASGFVGGLRWSLHWRVQALAITAGLVLGLLLAH